MSITNISKPKTQKGRRILDHRAPKIIENDKCTLVLKGGHTNNIVTNFLDEIEKWKRAHRIPHETRATQKKTKNRHTDVFGSHIGRVNVGKLETLDKLRPGASLRTALTGRRKQGLGREDSTRKRKVTANVNALSATNKRLRFS